MRLKNTDKVNEKHFFPEITIELSALEGICASDNRNSSGLKQLLASSHSGSADTQVPWFGVDSLILPSKVSNWSADNFGFHPDAYKINEQNLLEVDKLGYLTSVII